MTKSGNELLEILLEAGHVTEEQFKQIEKKAEESGQSADDVLQSSHIVDDEMIIKGRATLLNIPYIDLVFFDIKIANPDSHQKYTGKSNRKIFDNLRRLLQEKPAVVHPRIPLIPGITTTRENLSAIVEFLCEAGARNVTLLPYNPLGIEMAVSLGRPKASLPEAFMTPDKEKEVFSMFQTILKKRRDKVRSDVQESSNTKKALIKNLTVMK